MKSLCTCWLVGLLILAGMPNLSEAMSQTVHLADDEPIQTTDDDHPIALTDESSGFVKSPSGVASLLSTYQQNYLLPAYYTQKPYQAYYEPRNPNDGAIRHNEVKFQLSVKALLANFKTLDMQIYGAYTQRSYWQAYQKSAFFRESDYQPELFASFLHNRSWGPWSLAATDVGFVHQSNGRGGDEERSWGRVYLRQTLKLRRWSLEGTLSQRINSGYDYNPDIVYYLGNDILKTAYVMGRNTLTLALHNQLSSGFSRGSETLSWSFPLTKRIKGFVQVFSGYGQSLGEYNHYTNAVGLGVSLSDGL